MYLTLHRRYHNEDKASPTYMHLESRAVTRPPGRKSQRNSRDQRREVCIPPVPERNACRCQVGDGRHQSSTTSARFAVLRAVIRG